MGDLHHLRPDRGVTDLIVARLHAAAGDRSQVQQAAVHDILVASITLAYTLRQQGHDNASPMAVVATMLPGLVSYGGEWDDVCSDIANELAALQPKQQA